MTQSNLRWGDMYIVDSRILGKITVYLSKYLKHHSVIVKYKGLESIYSL